MVNRVRYLVAEGSGELLLGFREIEQRIGDVDVSPGAANALGCAS